MEGGIYIYIYIHNIKIRTDIFGGAQYFHSSIRDNELIAEELVHTFLRE